MLEFYTRERRHGAYFACRKNTQSQLVEFSLQHEPQLSFSKYITQNFNNTYGVKRIIDYDEVWDYSLKQRYRNNLFLGGFVGYDDSPRRGKMEL